MRNNNDFDEESTIYRFPAQRKAALATLRRLREEVKTLNTPAMRALVRQWENRVKWFERKQGGNVGEASLCVKGPRRRPRESGTPEANTPLIGLDALLPPL